MRYSFVVSALLLAASSLALSTSTRAQESGTAEAKAKPATTAPKSEGKDGKSEPAKAEGKKLVLASLTLKSSYPEGPGQAGLFGELELNLHKLVERLDKIADDDKVAGVILKFRNPDIGRGKIDELRAAIARVRKSGKKVYADLQDALGNEYLLASACDEIIMPPSGTLAATGVRMEVVFFKDLLDRVGVKADFMQVGDFKGAAEPLTRSEMSPELRSQLQALVDDYYEQMVAMIAADRKLDPGRVKDLIDQGIFTAAKAKEAGLIDRIAYEDEVQEQLKKQLEADELEIVQDYGRKEVDTDFSGLAGMMKFMELMAGGDGSKKSSKAKKIAVVYAVGQIGTGESSSGLLAESVGSDTVIKALRKAADDETVVAIVLRVDSPGGSALASDLIWREVVRIEKPIIASMGDIAASGGYYISMGADQIFAEPGTLTGSIGVVGGKVAVEKLMNKVGVKTEVVSRGRNSGWMSSTEAFTDSERDAWREMMQDIYRQFTTKAAEGRNMELETLEGLAQGKVYTGRMALGNKLVDKLGTLDDAVAEAKRLGGLAEGDKSELLILPEPKSFFDELFGGPELSMQASLKLLPTELRTALGDLSGVVNLFLDRPVLTLLPYRVKIR